MQYIDGKRSGVAHYTGAVRYAVEIGINEKTVTIEQWRGL